METKTITLYNEDCIPVMARTRLGSVDLLLTDPPYNLGKIEWDRFDTPEWEKKADEFCREAARVVRIGGAVVVFMAMIKIETLIKIARRHRLHYKTTGIWHKRNPLPRNMHYHFLHSTEAWVYFVNRKRTGTFNNEGKALHDFFECPVPGVAERRHGKHPTQKPLALMEYLIHALTRPGDTVMDPYMGSGSCGVAAAALGRGFIGAETNAAYYEISRRRLSAGSGGGGE